MSQSSNALAPVALVIDGDPIVRIVGEEALSAIGFDVIEAESGEAALDCLSDRTPDLVLLDVTLPGMDGYAVCEEMRRMPELAGVPILILTGRTDANTVTRAFEAGASDFIKKPLDWKLIQHRACTLISATRTTQTLESTVHDLEQSRSQLDAVRELARMGNWEIDLESGQMVWSRELHRLVGSAPSPSSPLKLEDMTRLLPESEQPALQKAVRSVVENGLEQEIEHQLNDATGEARFVRQHIVSVEETSGRRIIRGTIQDVTEKHRAEEKARYLEQFDAVTQLPNRVYLRERLEALLEGCRTSGSSLGVFCVDLDRFDRINQAFGYALGDDLLRAVGERIVDAVCNADYAGRVESPPEVARIGGAEFFVVVSGLVHEATALQVAKLTLSACDEPYFVGENQKVSLSASIGIATFNVTGAEGDADALMNRARLASRCARQAGGRCSRFFDPNESSTVDAQFALETDLADAIKGEGLVLEYQPQTDASTGMPVAVEALIRWDHPKLGRLMPNDFIPLAESSGLVGPLTEWVLRESCRQTAAWDAAGLPPIRMCANVSSMQFKGGRVIDMVRSALDAYDVEPDRLEIEITETALLGDGKDVERTCEALRKIGVSLALDDFGTGYSSLSHLIRFQIDVLKIDRSFTSEIRSSERARAIIAAMIAMSVRLGLTVVAEGVEVPEDADYMRTEGCHLLQGYGICRPTPPDKLDAWMREQLTRVESRTESNSE